MTNKIFLDDTILFSTDKKGLPSYKTSAKIHSITQQVISSFQFAPSVSF